MDEEPHFSNDAALYGDFCEVRGPKKHAFAAIASSTLGKSGRSAQNEKMEYQRLVPFFLVSAARQSMPCRAALAMMILANLPPMLASPRRPDRHNEKRCDATPIEPPLIKV